MSEFYCNGKFDVQQWIDAGRPEVWADVVGFEGFYQVSTWGRLRSLTRSVSCLSWKHGKRKYPVNENTKTPKAPKNGYAVVCLYNAGKVKGFSLHSLILKTFVGPCPEGMECRHLDGNKNNNRLDNLAWGTKQEQMEDVERHGRRIKGNDVYGSKLTEAQVLEIRRRYKPGQYGLALSLRQEFGISGVTLFNIVKRKTWRHI